MGFYSFYKILKDMLRTLFGKELLKSTFIVFLILTIFAVLVLFVCPECFASFTNNTINPTSSITITLNDWYDNYYWFIGAGVKNNTSYTALFISDNPFTVHYYGDNFYATGSVNCYRDLSSSYNNNNYNWFNSHINKSEPTLTSDTNPLIIGGNYVGINYFSNFDINYDNGSTFLFATNPRITYPILTNTQTELENLSFNNFNVQCQSYSNQDVYMLFYNRSLSNSQTTDGLYPISTKLLAPQSIYYDVENSTSENAHYTIPIWKTGVLFNVGSTYEIRFATISYNSEYDTPVYNYIGDTYSFTISSNVTQDYINQLNQQTATSTDNETTQELQISINNQTNAIENQTQSIENINSSITNSDVENSSIDLPTDNTVDPTKNGVDNIFQTIYNSFTSGTPQDIVFPVPNTSSQIIIKPNYLYDNLQNIEWGSWIINFIQAFYWYVISRFIITDIMGKIRKIKEGNIENLQNSNIKEDML